MELSRTQRYIARRAALLGPTNYFNLARAFRVESCDGALLAEALHRLCDAHEVFTYQFSDSDNEYVQHRTDAPHVKVDLQIDSRPAREEECIELLACEQEAAFDLVNQPLCRATILQRADGVAFLVINIHHIISDEWSLRLAFNELWATCESLRQRQPHPRNLAPPYSTYIQWQQQLIGSGAYQSQLSHWVSRLGDLELTRADGDWRRHVTRSCSVTYGSIGSAATNNLDLVARKERAPVFLCLLAYFCMLLEEHRPGEGDLVVGTHFANRKRPQFAAVLGHFAHWLTWRIDVSGSMSFREVLAVVKREAQRVYENSDVDIDDIADALGGRLPFKVGFSLQTVGYAGLQDVRHQSAFFCRQITREQSRKLSPVDLNFHLIRTAGGYLVRAIFDERKFSRQQVDAMVRDFERVLFSDGADPSRSYIGLHP